MTEIPVIFVVLPRVLLLDLAGPAEALRLAGKLGAADADGCPIRFSIRYVGVTPTITSSINLQLAAIEPLPRELPDNAVVFVAGTETVHDRSEIEKAERVIAKWLRAAQPRRLLTVCSGALVAARAGILDGKECTTHHTLTAELKQLAPSATVLENRLYVTDGAVSTSAGITAGIDMTLRFIADTGGAKAASAVARDMVVYMRRAGTDPQLSPWLEGRNHLHPALHRVQDAVTADPTRAWSVDDMSSIAYTSPRHLTRLFQEHIGTTPLDYLHRLRIAVARDLLATSDLSIEIVAERAGFGSARHLRRIWQKFESRPPSRARAG